MTIFYIIYTFLFLSCIFEYKKKAVGITLMIFLFVVLTFRGINVGSDTIMYYTNSFFADLEFSLTNKFEISFQLISYAIKETGIDSRWCLYILSILTFFFLYLSARKYNKILGTSYVWFFTFFFLLGFYSLAFNISRQILAVSILLYSYSFLFEKNHKRRYFFLYVFLASSFHISSIIFIFVFFIDKLKIDRIPFKITFIILLVAFTFVALCKNLILNFLTSKFSALELYGSYVEDTIISKKSFFGILIDYCDFCLSMFVYYWLAKNIKNRTLSNLFVVSIIASIFLMPLYGNINRIGLGIKIIQVVGYATCFTYQGSYQIMKLAKYFSIIFFGYFILVSLSNGAYDIVPYYFTL